MHCPHCLAPFESAVPACPACGLSIRELDRHFGPVPRHNSVLTDWAHVFDRAATARLNRGFRLLHRQFPQVRFSVFTCHLSSRPAREYGFWLFNRCRFTEAGLRGARSFGLLLLLNTGNGEASITTGYGLEKVLTTEELDTALRAGVNRWADGRFEEGVRDCLEAMVRVLKLHGGKQKGTEHRPGSLQIGSAPAFEGGGR